MNVLEKILEEIERTRKSIIDMSDEEPELVDAEDWFDEGVDQGKLIAYEVAKEIIRSHIDHSGDDTEMGDWIPVEEGLPEVPEENPIFDNKPLELYLVDIGAEYPIRAFWNGSDFTDGWTILKAIAWQPLPERYKGDSNA